MCMHLFLISSPCSADAQMREVSTGASLDCGPEVRAGAVYCSQAV